jgi:uncharacterized protein
MDALSPNLFMSGPDGPRLRAGRCRSTGRLVFPKPDGPAAQGFADHALGTHGTLWSWTVQQFPPKGMADFSPYMVGYVELPGELIVESRIVGLAAAHARIGLPLVFTTTSVGGKTAYAFTPEGAA